MNGFKRLIAFFFLSFIAASHSLAQQCKNCLVSGDKRYSDYRVILFSGEPTSALRRIYIDSECRPDPPTHLIEQPEKLQKWYDRYGRFYVVGRSNLPEKVFTYQAVDSLSAVSNESYVSLAGFLTYKEATFGIAHGVHGSMGGRFLLRYIPDMKLEVLENRVRLGPYDSNRDPYLLVDMSRWSCRIMSYGAYEDTRGEIPAE